MCISASLGLKQTQTLNICFIRQMLKENIFLRSLFSYIACVSCVMIWVVLPPSQCVFYQSVQANTILTCFSSQSTLQWQGTGALNSSLSIKTTSLFTLMLTVVSDLWRQAFWLMSRKWLLLDMCSEMCGCECDWNYSKFTLTISISLMTELLFTWPGAV